MSSGASVACWCNCEATVGHPCVFRSLLHAGAIVVQQLDIPVSSGACCMLVQLWCNSWTSLCLQELCCMLVQLWCNSWTSLCLQELVACWCNCDATVGWTPLCLCEIFLGIKLNYVNFFSHSSTLLKCLFLQCTGSLRVAVMPLTHCHENCHHMATRSGNWSSSDVIVCLHHTA